MSKIIKDFSEFNKPEDKLWRVSIESKADCGDLTPEQIEDVLDILNDEYYIEYQNNFNQKMKDEYDQYPVSNWQNAKSSEIEEIFRKSLKYDIKDNQVSVKVSFDIDFLDNFDKQDVYQWIQGLSRLVNAHSMIQIEKIMGRKEKAFDEELSKKERDFLIKLERSQKWNVEQI